MLERPGPQPIYAKVWLYSENCLMFKSYYTPNSCIVVSLTFIYFVLFYLHYSWNSIFHNAFLSLKNYASIIVFHNCTILPLIKLVLSTTYSIVCIVLPFQNYPFILTFEISHPLMDYLKLHILLWIMGNYLLSTPYNCESFIHYCVLV
jgi:hypothetical protein